MTVEYFEFSHHLICMIAIEFTEPHELEYEGKDGKMYGLETCSFQYQRQLRHICACVCASVRGTWGKKVPASIWKWIK